MIITEANRIERIIFLSMAFRDGRTWTTQDAAQETGVSVRTIQRDFSLMSRMLPIYSDGNEWRYVDNSQQVKISPY